MSPLMFSIFYSLGEAGQGPRVLLPNLVRAAPAPGLGLPLGHTLIMLIIIIIIIHINNILLTWLGAELVTQPPPPPEKPPAPPHTVAVT